MGDKEEEFIVQDVVENAQDIEEGTTSLLTTEHQQIKFKDMPVESLRRIYASDDMKRVNFHSVEPRADFEKICNNLAAKKLECERALYNTALFLSGVSDDDKQWVKKDAERSLNFDYKPVAGKFVTLDNGEIEFVVHGGGEDIDVYLQELKTEFSKTWEKKDVEMFLISDVIGVTVNTALRASNKQVDSNLFLDAMNKEIEEEDPGEKENKNEFDLESSHFVMEEQVAAEPVTMSVVERRLKIIQLMNNKNCCDPNLFVCELGGGNADDLGSDDTWPTHSIEKKDQASYQFIEPLDILLKKTTDNNRESYDVDETEEAFGDGKEDKDARADDEDEDIISRDIFSSVMTSMSMLTLNMPPAIPKEKETASTIKAIKDKEDEEEKLLAQKKQKRKDLRKNMKTDEERTEDIKLEKEEERAEHRKKEEKLEEERLKKYKLTAYHEKLLSYLDFLERVPGCWDPIDKDDQKKKKNMEKHPIKRWFFDRAAIMVEDKSPAMESVKKDLFVAAFHAGDVKTALYLSISGVKTENLLGGSHLDKMSPNQALIYDTLVGQDDKHATMIVYAMFEARELLGNREFETLRRILINGHELAEDRYDTMDEAFNMSHALCNLENIVKGKEDITSHNSEFINPRQLDFFWESPPQPGKEEEEVAKAKAKKASDTQEIVAKIIAFTLQRIPKRKKWQKYPLADIAHEYLNLIKKTMSWKYISEAMKVYTPKGEKQSKLIFEPLYKKEIKNPELIFKGRNAWMAENIQGMFVLLEEFTAFVKGRELSDFSAVTLNALGYYSREFDHYLADSKHTVSELCTSLVALVRCGYFSANHHFLDLLKAALENDLIDRISAKRIIDGDWDDKEREKKFLDGFGTQFHINANKIKIETVKNKLVEERTDFRANQMIPSIKLLEEKVGKKIGDWYGCPNTSIFVRVANLISTEVGNLKEALKIIKTTSNLFEACYTLAKKKQNSFMHSKDGQQTNRGDTAMKRRTDNLIEYHIQCLLGFVYFNQLYHLSKQNETVSKKCTRFGREIEVSLDIEAKLFGIKNMEDVAIVYGNDEKKKDRRFRMIGLLWIEDKLKNKYVAKQQLSGRVIDFNEIERFVKQRSVAKYGPENKAFERWANELISTYITESKLIDMKKNGGWDDVPKREKAVKVLRYNRNHLVILAYLRYVIKEGWKHTGTFTEGITSEDKEFYAETLERYRKVGYGRMMNEFTGEFTFEQALTCIKIIFLLKDSPNPGVLVAHVLSKYITNGDDRGDPRFCGILWWWFLTFSSDEAAVLAFCSGHLYYTARANTWPELTPTLSVIFEKNFAILLKRGLVIGHTVDGSVTYEATDPEIELDERNYIADYGILVSNKGGRRVIPHLVDPIKPTNQKNERMNKMASLFASLSELNYVINIDGLEVPLGILNKLPASDPLIKGPLWVAINKFYDDVKSWNVSPMATDLSSFLVCLKPTITGNTVPQTLKSLKLTNGPSNLARFIRAELSLEYNAVVADMIRKSVNTHKRGERNDYILRGLELLLIAFYEERKGLSNVGMKQEDDQKNIPATELPELTEYKSKVREMIEHKDRTFDDWTKLLVSIDFEFRDATQKELKIEKKVKKDAKGNIIEEVPDKNKITTAKTIAEEKTKADREMQSLVVIKYLIDHRYSLAMETLMDARRYLLGGIYCSSDLTSQQLENLIVSYTSKYQVDYDLSDYLVPLCDIVYPKGKDLKIPRGLTMIKYMASILSLGKKSKKELQPSSVVFDAKRVGDMKTAISLATGLDKEDVDGPVNCALWMEDLEEGNTSAHFDREWKAMSKEKDFEDGHRKNIILTFHGLCKGLRDCGARLNVYYAKLDVVRSILESPRRSIKLDDEVDYIGASDKLDSAIKEMIPFLNGKRPIEYDWEMFDGVKSELYKALVTFNRATDQKVPSDETSDPYVDKYGIGDLMEKEFQFLRMNYLPIQLADAALNTLFTPAFCFHSYHLQNGYNSEMSMNQEIKYKILHEYKSSKALLQSKNFERYVNDYHAEMKPYGEGQGDFFGSLLRKDDSEPLDTKKVKKDEWNKDRLINFESLDAKKVKKTDKYALKELDALLQKNRQVITTLSQGDTTTRNQVVIKTVNPGDFLEYMVPPSNFSTTAAMILYDDVAFGKHTPVIGAINPFERWKNILVKGDPVTSTHVGALMANKELVRFIREAATNSHSSTEKFTTEEFNRYLLGVPLLGGKEEQTRIQTRTEVKFYLEMILYYHAMLASNKISQFENNEINDNMIAEAIGSFRSNLISTLKDDVILTTKVSTIDGGDLVVDAFKYDLENREKGLKALLESTRENGISYENAKADPLQYELGSITKGGNDTEEIEAIAKTAAEEEEEAEENENQAARQAKEDKKKEKAQERAEEKTNEMDETMMLLLNG